VTLLLLDINSKIALMPSTAMDKKTKIFRIKIFCMLICRDLMVLRFLNISS
jgi:hypothetical protein